MKTSLAPTPMIAPLPREKLVGPRPSATKSHNEATYTAQVQMPKVQMPKDIVAAGADEV